MYDSIWLGAKNILRESHGILGLAGFHQAIEKYGGPLDIAMISEIFEISITVHYPDNSLDFFFVRSPSASIASIDILRHGEERCAQYDLLVSSIDVYRTLTSTDILLPQLTYTVSGPEDDPIIIHEEVAQAVVKDRPHQDMTIVIGRLVVAQKRKQMYAQLLEKLKGMYTEHNLDELLSLNHFALKKWRPKGARKIDDLFRWQFLTNPQQHFIGQLVFYNIKASWFPSREWDHGNVGVIVDVKKTPDEEFDGYIFVQWLNVGEDGSIEKMFNPKIGKERLSEYRVNVNSLKDNSWSKNLEFRYECKIPGLVQSIKDSGKEIFRKFYSEEEELFIIKKYQYLLKYL